MRETFCALLIAASAVTAQSPGLFDWVGVWEGELDGQPSVVLTLTADESALQGTLVLNGISRDSGPPHIAVREAHVLMHAKVSGRTLSFEVKGLRGSGATISFAVEQLSNQSAKIHCLNCGGGAPIVDLTKQD